MNNLSYKVLKKALDQYIFEQKIRAFLKSQYGIEEKNTFIKNKPLEIKSSEFIKEVQNNAKWIKAYLKQEENKKISDSTEKYLDIEDKIKQIKRFIFNHENRVGEKQATKDIQRGLNILNNYDKTSNLEVKRPIKEDGDFGRITNACLNRICKFYPIHLIKRAIKIGAFNNAYSNSYFDKKINLDKEVNNISNNLNYVGDIK